MAALFSSAASPRTLCWEAVALRWLPLVTNGHALNGTTAIGKRALQ